MECFGWQTWITCLTLGADEEALTRSHGPKMYEGVDPQVKFVSYFRRRANRCRSSNRYSIWRQSNLLKIMVFLHLCFQYLCYPIFFLVALSRMCRTVLENVAIVFLDFNGNASSILPFSIKWCGAWAPSLTTILSWRLVCTAQNEGYKFLGIEISGKGGTNILVPGWVWGLFWSTEPFSPGSDAWFPPILLPKWVPKDPVHLFSHNPQFCREREFLGKWKAYGNPSQTQVRKDWPHHNVHATNSSYVQKC